MNTRTGLALAGMLGRDALLAEKERIWREKMARKRKIKSSAPNPKPSKK